LPSAKEKTPEVGLLQKESQAAYSQRWCLDSSDVRDLRDHGQRIQRTGRSLAIRSWQSWLVPGPTDAVNAANGAKTDAAPLRLLIFSLGLCFFLATGRQSVTPVE